MADGCVAGVDGSWPGVARGRIASDAVELAMSGCCLDPWSSGMYSNAGRSARSQFADALLCKLIDSLPMPTTGSPMRLPRAAPGEGQGRALLPPPGARQSPSTSRLIRCARKPRTLSPLRALASSLASYGLTAALCLHLAVDMSTSTSSSTMMF